MTKIALVDPEQLAHVIDHLKDALTPHQVEFLKARWLHQLIYWDQRSRHARHIYFALRAVTVLGGVTIPVLTSLSLVNPPRASTSLAAAIIGALVAAAAAWEGVANYGQVWLEKRRAAELLKVEGWLYFQQADRYADLDSGAAFPRFAAEVERLIAKEVGEYVGVFDVTESAKRASQFDDLLKAAIERHVKVPST